MSDLRLVPLPGGGNLDPLVREAIDKTMNQLATRVFPVDPLIPARWSRRASVVSSFYKRHGNIIDLALRTKLVRAGLCVWKESKFLVSEAADRLATDDRSLAAHLEYGECFRIIQIDVIVVYFKDTIRAYECKRGFGYNDAGKKRSMIKDLRCTQMLLRSYAAQRTPPIFADRAEAKAIFYYGQAHDGLGPKWSMTRDDLDDHFGIPGIIDAIEAANSYSTERLTEILENLHE